MVIRIPSRQRSAREAAQIRRRNYDLSFGVGKVMSSAEGTVAGCYACRPAARNLFCAYNPQKRRGAV
jgi:hypothetical protein